MDIPPTFVLVQIAIGLGAFFFIMWLASQERWRRRPRQRRDTRAD